METLIIKSYDDFQKKLGSGLEGDVFAYKDKYAIKVFSRSYWAHSECRSLDKLNQKMKKVEAMIKLKDPSASFPLGFVEMPYNQDAYYTQIVLSSSKDFQTKSLTDYEFYSYSDKLEKILIKADATLERLHKMGIALGDIRESNILLRDGVEPVFIDMDNVAYDDYPFDLIPDRANCFSRIYRGSKKNLIDNDKLVFGLMALYFKTRDENFMFYNGARRIQNGLDKLEVTDKEAKEKLECIFSDAKDKPYIGKILKKIR